MPKPIKRKIAKTKPAVEEDFTSVMARITETVERRQRQLITAGVAIVVILALSLGLYAYRASTAGEAERLAYEGYKLYHGLYEQTPLPREERLNRALENFQKSYEKRETAYSLYYVASCYYQLGKYDVAISMLRELNGKFPDDEKFVPLSYYKIAMAHQSSGNTDEALKTLEVLSGYRTDSYKDLALVESARMLDAMGKPEEAKEKYRQIAQRFPGSAFMAEARMKVGVDDEQVGDENKEGKGQPEEKKGKESGG